MVNRLAVDRSCAVDAEQRQPGIDSNQDDREGEDGKSRWTQERCYARTRAFVRWSSQRGHRRCLLFVCGSTFHSAARRFLFLEQFSEGKFVLHALISTVNCNQRTSVSPRFRQ